MDQGFKYNGTVKIKIVKNGNVLEITNHNSGTQALKQNLCWFLAGNYTTGNIPSVHPWRYYLPGALDLYYIAPNQGGHISFLNNLQPLTGPTYVEEDSELGINQTDDLGNVYLPASTTYTGTLNYSNLVETIDATDTGRFLLVLKSGEDTDGSRRDLAYIPVAAKELSKLSPGTNAIVEWKMYFTDSNS